MPQRTPLQAYQHVLKALDAGTVSPELMSDHCVYTQGKKLNCGVGSLFTRAQLKDIKARGLNSQIIRAVGCAIGEHNLLEVTGLDMQQLEDLQEAHDCGRNEEFRKYVKSRIKRLTGH
jgi:hypothetical protein